jgi:hypothetical protein
MAQALLAWAEAVSGMGQAPKNGEDRIKQGQRRSDRSLVHIAPGQGDCQVRTDFPGSAQCRDMRSPPMLAKNAVGREAASEYKVGRRAMLQFFADQIDQLDLCLDQLAIRDRNFDRFALMLVDNVVELTLHRD